MTINILFCYISIAFIYNNLSSSCGLRNSIWNMSITSSFDVSNYLLTHMDYLHNLFCNYLLVKDFSFYNWFFVRVWQINLKQLKACNFNMQWFQVPLKILKHLRTNVSPLLPVISSYILACSIENTILGYSCKDLLIIVRK